MNLKEILEKIAAEFNAQPPKEVGHNVYLLDIPLVLKDGSKRYQYVFVRIVPQRYKGKDCIVINSRCGTYNPGINTYQILKESSQCVYTTITIYEDKTPEGKDCETVAIQASPILEATSYEELKLIIWEVAEAADIIEEKYFGGDKN
ncbi:MAG: hypothetical protein NZ519_13435 [Bacteroidia bacterium]|nr:hypothetical protein [Bacteroidia bacterium]MDW8302918.1 hypothetical protein [Bacteroidia bacterium]